MYHLIIEILRLICLKKDNKNILRTILRKKRKKKKFCVHNFFRRQAGVRGGPGNKTLRRIKAVYAKLCRLLECSCVVYY